MKKKQRINLLPKIYKEQRRRRKYQVIIYIGVIFEVIVFIFQVAYPSKLALRKSIETLEAVDKSWQDESLSEVNQVLKALDEKKEELEKWEEKYRQIQEENWINKGLLDSLISRVPVNVRINKMILPVDESLEEPSYTVSIEGNSDDMIALLNYITILEGTFGNKAVYYECEHNEYLSKYEYRLQIDTSKIRREQKQEVIKEDLDEINIEGVQSE